MQQKAQFIATLIHEPELIVVDEPFSNLDPINARLVISILEEQQQAGRTIIMSTHQLHMVEALCNRIALINKGRSVLYGEVEHIKREFGCHALVVEGEGDLSGLPGVLEVRPVTNGDLRRNGVWHLSLAEATQPGEVLRALPCKVASASSGSRSPSRRWTISSSRWWSGVGTEPECNDHA